VPYKSAFTFMIKAC